MSQCHVPYTIKNVCLPKILPTAYYYTLYCDKVSPTPWGIYIHISEHSHVYGTTVIFILILITLNRVFLLRRIFRPPEWWRQSECWKPRVVQLLCTWCWRNWEFDSHQRSSVAKIHHKIRVIAWPRYEQMKLSWNQIANF